MGGWPRPYTTLIVTGFEIAEGEIKKMGVVRVSKSDDRNGNVEITGNSFDWPGATDDPAQLLPVINAMIMARPDVQAILEEGAA
jgi:hypothetical protein